MVVGTLQVGALGVGEFGEFGEFGELICIFTSRADIEIPSGARIPLVQMSGGQLRADGLNVKIGCGVRGRFS